MTFELRILPSNHPPSSSSNNQFYFPSLLGLNSLSLSIPDLAKEHSASGQNPATSKRIKRQTQRITELVIRNLPTEQLHLLFSSSNAGLGIRTGFWLWIPTAIQRIDVRWDAETEELVLFNDLISNTATTDEAIQSSKINNESIKIFDYGHLLALKKYGPQTGLGGAKIDAKGMSEQDPWNDLTSYITLKDLDNIIPPASIKPGTTTVQNIRSWTVSTLSVTTTESHLSSTKAQSPNPDREPPVPSIHDQDINLCLPNISFARTFPPSAVGPSRTRWARDRSWYLHDILTTQFPLKTNIETPPSMAVHLVEDNQEARRSHIMLLRRDIGRI
jgi:hypothetical protein